MTERLRISIHMSNYFQTLEFLEKPLSDKNELSCDSLVGCGWNRGPRNISNGIFGRPFSSSCDRLVAATSHPMTLPQEDIQIAELESTLLSHNWTSHGSSFRTPLWPIERHFVLDMHLLRHQWCPTLSNNGSALASEDHRLSAIWVCIQLILYSWDDKSRRDHQVG